MAAGVKIIFEFDTSGMLHTSVQVATVITESWEVHAIWLDASCVFSTYHPRRPTAICALLSHYPRPTAHDSLPTVHCSLSTAH